MTTAAAVVVAAAAQIARSALFAEEKSRGLHKVRARARRRAGCLPRPASAGDARAHALCARRAAREHAQARMVSLARRESFST